MHYPVPLRQAVVSSAHRENLQVLNLCSWAQTVGLAVGVLVCLYLTAVEDTPVEGNLSRHNICITIQICCPPLESTAGF